MPHLKFSRTVSFSPQQMLDLVSDLNAYPDFVPNCSDMELSAQDGDPLSSCEARMHVSFGPINQSYSSRVSIDHTEMTVLAQSEDSPFSHLHSIWKFSDTGQGVQMGCKIQFDIDFEFSNRLIAAVAEPAFANIQGEILDAFIAEAKRRYA